MKAYEITLTTDSKMMSDEDLDKVLELSANGVEFHIALYSTFPLPWDAGFNIEDGKLILTGGVEPSDSECSAVITVPIEKVSKFLSIFIELIDEEYSAEITAILDKYDWQWKDTALESMTGHSHSM